VRLAGLIASAVIASVIIALATVPAHAAGAARTYANPILYADYSDPDVIRSGRDYYLVASSFHFSPGLPVLRSRDLVHWTIAGHVLKRLDFAPEYDMIPPFSLTDAGGKTGAGLRYAGGVWAPAIREHAGRFYVFWPTPQEGIFMATARRPEGPWSAPVKVIDGPGLEDPCPFWDDDGKAYLVHSKVGAGPLILHRMSPDGRRVLGEGHVIIEDKAALPVLEGPKLYKRGGWYYVFAPIGGVEKGSQAVLRSRSIEGPYEARVVLEKGSTEVQGPHQGGYVETPSGQGWFVHFNSTGAFGRIVYLEPVTWHDGWPLIGDPIPGKDAGQPVATHAAPDAGWAPLRLQDSDEFDAPVLGPQWEWNHNPDNRGWSLGERRGFLRLRAQPADGLVTARNTLTQILVGPRMVTTARIDLSHMAEGQRAGLAMFGQRPSWIGLVREQGRTRIAYASAGVETPGPETAGPFVELRVEVTADQTAHFSWRQGGGDFQPSGEPSPLRFAWWKGARPALFSFIKPADAKSAGWIDVDWVHVAHPAPDAPPDLQP
jgi:beta-xylosidase